MTPSALPHHAVPSIPMQPLAVHLEPADGLPADGSADYICRVRDCLRQVELTVPEMKDVVKQLEAAGCTVKKPASPGMRSRLIAADGTFGAKSGLRIDMSGRQLSPKVTIRLNIPSSAEHSAVLWQASLHAASPEWEDRVLGVVLNVAVVAHAALLAEGVLTSYEKGDWLKIDTFQTVCMFDESGNSKPEGRQTLMDALGRKEQVSHLSLDAEGKGHCSCHHVCVYALGDDCPTRGKVDTFVQLGIWFKDGSCSVFLDYYPNQWLEEVATALPGVVVTTWGEERIARSVFGTCALDLQAELTGRICDDLKLPIPRDGKLGLKRAYGWVAHCAGRTVYDYSSGLEVCHQPEYVWQRRYPSYLSDRHKRYAAVDAFATAAIYGTYKYDRRMIINLPS